MSLAVRLSHTPKKKRARVFVFNAGMESEDTASTQSDEEEEEVQQGWRAGFGADNFADPDGFVNKASLGNRTFWREPERSDEARKRLKELNNDIETDREAFRALLARAVESKEIYGMVPVKTTSLRRLMRLAFGARYVRDEPSEEDDERARKLARLSTPWPQPQRWEFEWWGPTGDVPFPLPYIDTEVILPIIAYDFSAIPLGRDTAAPLPTAAQLRAVQKRADRAHRDQARASVRQQKRNRPPRMQKHVANRRAPQKWR